MSTMELRKRRLTRIRSMVAQYVPVLDSQLAVCSSLCSKNVFATSKPCEAHSSRQRLPLSLATEGGGRRLGRCA